MAFIIMIYYRVGRDGNVVTSATTEDALIFEWLVVFGYFLILLLLIPGIVMGDEGPILVKDNQ